jgi:hypothetical protein
VPYSFLDLLDIRFSHRQALLDIGRALFFSCQGNAYLSECAPVGVAAGFLSGHATSKRLAW